MLHIIEMTIKKGKRISTSFFFVLPKYRYDMNQLNNENIHKHKKCPFFLPTHSYFCYSSHDVIPPKFWEHVHRKRLIPMKVEIS